MDKKKWLERWKQALIDSGYYFFMDVKYIESRLTESEIIELSPEESAWIYIETAKEVWNMSEDEREGIEQFVMENRGG